MVLLCSAVDKCAVDISNLEEKTDPSKNPL